MPTKVEEYCNYFAQGYMGYTFDKAEGSPTQYPCPAAAELGSNSQTNSTGQWFCTLNKQSTGGTFPPNAKADCSDLAGKGVFGYSWQLR